MPFHLPVLVGFDAVRPSCVGELAPLDVEVACGVVEELATDDGAESGPKADFCVACAGEECMGISTAVAGNSMNQVMARVL